jgi:L-ascorbate metabolism protein UlaG (beta-lactamase superfamily)
VAASGGTREINAGGKIMRLLMALAVRMGGVAAVLAIIIGAGPAVARGCFPLAERGLPGIHFASLPAGATVGITYLGHSSFWIETAGGATAITDYNGFHVGPETPDIVTMNNAHGTHFTNNPDPGIAHVLRGWNPAGGVAEHDLDVGDLRVRNIPTSVHGRSGAQGNSNSIFVFEVEDLCIAHLGHLHHVLTDMHLGELGLIDILMVPIDGSYTIGQELMRQVVEQIGPSVVIPMHYFGEASLNRFLSLMSDEWTIAAAEVSSVAYDRLSLPQRQNQVLRPTRY